MIIPTFYGGGEQDYFNARRMIETTLKTWAGRALTGDDEAAVDELMGTIKRRVSSSFEDRALESMIEEAHTIGSI